MQRALCHYESPRTIWGRVAKPCNLPGFLSHWPQGQVSYSFYNDQIDQVRSQCIVHTVEKTGRHLF